jgi:hypothetical protein
LALGRIVFRLPHSAHVRIDVGAVAGRGAVSVGPAVGGPVGSVGSVGFVVWVVGALVVSVMACASSHDPPG